MDCSLPGSTVHGIFQARVLEWGAIAFSVQYLPNAYYPGIVHFHAMEKAMATHSSVLAWKIPWTVEPGGLPSMGLHRVGHD